MAISQMVAVCLLIGGVAAAPSPLAIEWHIVNDNVVAGSTVTVQGDSGPQFPIYVRLIIDGVLRDNGEILLPGGTCTLDVPAGTSGLDWKIEVESGSETDDETGQVG